MSAPEIPATAIRVRVLRAGTGRAVPSVTLTVLDGEGSQVARGNGGDDGVFRTGLPGPGDYLLIAAAGGHEPRSATVTLPDPGEYDVELSLPGRNGGVAGTVTGPGGPVDGATVVVHDVRGEVVATTVTGGDGRYVVTDLSPAVYTVVAVAPGMEPVTDSIVVDTTGDTGWDATLPAPVHAGNGAQGRGRSAGGNGTLSGTARTKDGRPLGDARVALLNGDGTSVAVADTDAEGRYRFGDLPPGDYTVITTGYPPVADVLHVEGGQRYDPVLGHPELT
ncbi:MSCRAMM family protein [Pseudonocardia endophytica]|uniref:Carboxypeptidase family protein n=1 Tax=Pseudonocardia endophytica TaxID=401976 RepID=A0A4R1HYH5_PSEEN|nr:carboxypeptidase-like regulatory domain-containing protein [Pseudonocardia endophytica]TCK26195.1 carboxypeptidase family protein [Pseudonocardia endophytica]